MPHFSELNTSPCNLKSCAGLFFKVPFLTKWGMKESTTTIFTDIIHREIKSPDRCMMLLSYLKIRVLASNRAGTFTKDMFVFATGLHPRTAHNHINSLIDKKFIVKLGVNRYRIVSLKKITHAQEKDYLVRLPVDEIMSYSWKTIRAFRAHMVELLYEVVEHRKKTFRSVKEYTRINLRDKSREQVPNEWYLDPSWHHRISLSYGNLMTGLTKSTLSRYRTAIKGTVDYKHRQRVIYNHEWAASSDKLKLWFKSFKGRLYTFNNVQYASDISTRNSNDNITVLRHYKKRKNRIKLSLKDSVCQTIQFEAEMPF